MNQSELVKILEALPIDIVLWIVFGITIIVFGIYSAILLWHWKIYSTGKFTTVSNMILYLGVSAVCIVIMIGSALAYTFI